MPSVGYEIGVNLGQIPDAEIQALHNKFLAASLLAMKYSAWKEKLNALIPTIFTLVSETDKNLQTCLIVYTLKGNSLTNEQILDLIAPLPIKRKEDIMDTLELFEEKGRRRGIEEGKREGREEKTRDAVKNMIRQSSLTNEQIASIMEVTVDYVAELRRNLAAE